MRIIHGNLRYAKMTEPSLGISFISHPNKIMLRVISNRLKRKAEQIQAEEQVAFRAGRSATELIFNVSPLRMQELVSAGQQIQRLVQTFKTKRFRRLLRISYIVHKTNKYVRQVETLAGNQEPFLATVK